MFLSPSLMSAQPPNAIPNIFTSIATKNARFHVLCEQIHVLPPSSVQLFHQWIDIVLWDNDICILLNIIIVNPIQIDLVFWIVSSCEVGGCNNGGLNKEGFDQDWHLNKHVSSLCHRGIQVLTLTSKLFFSSMY